MPTSNPPVQVATLKPEAAQQIVTDAQTARDQAQGHASDASQDAAKTALDVLATEAARDAVFAMGGGPYSTSASGIADTSPGDFFVVANEAGWQLFENDDGTPEPRSGVSPSLSALRDQNEAALGDTIKTRNDFYTELSEVALSVTVNGQEVLAFDEDGALIGSGESEIVDLDAHLLVYSDGDNLRTVGADDEIAAELGSYTALSTQSVSDIRGRAVIDWPARGPARSVSVAPGLGLMIPDAENVLHVIIGMGQSLMVGSQAATSLLSTTAVWPDDVLMFTRGDDGALSNVRMGLVTSGAFAEIPTLDPDLLTAFEPLVARAGPGSGSRGQTPMESMANSLAQQARDIGARFRSLSFTAAHGGAPYNELKRGTTPYANMLAALTKAVTLAEEMGWKVIVDACLNKHGEADQVNTSYLADLLEWQQHVDEDVKGITGQQADVHFIMGMPSAVADFQSVSAMLEAHNTSPFHHLSGPDYPFGEAYASDEIHFTGPGYFWIGETMARAWKQALWSAAQKSKIVQMLDAGRTGTSVVIEYEVPVEPLVFDTETVSERDVKGFRYFDGSGEISVSDAVITGPAQITLTLASIPSGSDERVEYATSPQSNPRTEANRVRGNVRDSATDISDHEERPLYNWAVHQSIEVTVV